MPYEPRNPHHLRYAADFGHNPELMKTMEDYVLRLNRGLGYDFNTVEFAVRDGIPIAIDFCNPAPDADINSVGQENFDWVVQTAAQYAIEKALQYREGHLNLTWGAFTQAGVADRPRAELGTLSGPQPAASPQKEAEPQKPAAPKAARPKKEAGPAAQPAATTQAEAAPAAAKPRKSAKK